MTRRLRAWWKNVRQRVTALWERMLGRRTESTPAGLSAPTPEPVVEPQASRAEESGRNETADAPEPIDAVYVEGPFAAPEPEPQLDLRFDSPKPEVPPTPELIEDETPEVIEDETPEVIEDETPEVIEDETPEVIEDETPEVIEDETPEVIEDETPEVIEDE
ncbi:MAG: hypothetical protein AAF658_14630, partial [Myxococcota bacterium]